MTLPIKEQFGLLSFFLNQPYFKGSAIVNDIRIIPFMSGAKFLYNEVKNLTSLEIVLPEGSDFSLGKWYPPGESKLLAVYEKMSNKGLELDIEVVDKILYDNIISKEHALFGIKVSLCETRNMGTIDKYNKITDFSLNKHKIIKNYLSVIRADDDSLEKNLCMYKEMYCRYIEIKQKIITSKNIKYKKELLDFFIDYRLYEFKNRYKFYKTLLNYGHETLSEILNNKEMETTKILYFKNISVTKNEYSGKIHKVYNIESSKRMKEGFIMVAKNTSPEFIAAFYKAKCICVETSSEITHASITCKELNIPLALGAKNIRKATRNMDSIHIETIKKEISL